MLDHLEKSTGRLYQSGLVLKDEAVIHNQLLDGRKANLVSIFTYFVPYICNYVCTAKACV